MNICLKLKKEEPEKITTTKELAQYILESGNDVEKIELCKPYIEFKNSHYVLQNYIFFA